MGHQRAVRRSTIVYTRYRLCVAATDVGELVASAGGWMCDRIQAGWDVSVAVTKPRDLRPLRILGVTSVVTEYGFESLSHAGEIAAIALASESFDHNEHLRGAVLKVLDHGGEVTIWGATIPSQLDGRVRGSQYRLSSVARALKTHAIAAAEIPAADISETEDLHIAAPWYDASANGDDTHRLAAGQGKDR